MVRSLLLLLCTAGAAAVQSSFEGVITMSIADDDGKANTLTYMVKGGKIRIDMPGGRGEDPIGVIVDPAAKKVLILMPSEKMYMEQAINAAAVNAAKAKAPTVTRTGKTEMIAGYACEHIIVTEDNGSTSDVCTAKGLGTFQMPSSMGRGGPPKAQAWESSLDDGSFPLKVQKGGKVIVEVTKIDKRSLDAAYFAPPTGFEKFDMGAMMRKRP